MDIIILITHHTHKVRQKNKDIEPDMTEYVIFLSRRYPPNINGKDYRKRHNQALINFTYPD